MSDFKLISDIYQTKDQIFKVELKKSNSEIYLTNYDNFPKNFKLEFGIITDIFHEIFSASNNYNQKVSYKLGTTDLDKIQDITNAFYLELKEKANSKQLDIKLGKLNSSLTYFKTYWKYKGLLNIVENKDKYSIYPTNKLDKLLTPALNKGQRIHWASEMNLKTNSKEEALKKYYQPDQKLLYSVIYCDAKKYIKQTVEESI